MSLTTGEKLGSYEILDAIGAGGMGEVYRARDTKLGREVAIKVLPEEFTQHPQKLARFEREARLLAALNHPGIATLHGLEEAEGKPFLVMELVEGETLAERIARGPLPVKEALTLSQQIAEALEAAHEKGVIHRDLKPANIKVDPEGQVKVLDFGLAKAFAEEVPESELSQSPTLSRDATRAGVILGTAAYMSPEQAKGKTVDKRTDIFSFGIVLYEMLTGKRAFSGEDVSDVLASIMKLEPDWSALPKDLDSRVNALLRRCLRKDRKLRRRDIGDVRVEIQEILAGRQLKKVSLAGGPPVTLCDAGSVRGASWGPDGAIVFATIESRVLLQVSASGGAPEPITTLENGERGHRWPHVLPGGKAVLFTVWSVGLERRIAVQSLETGERRLFLDGTYPRYAPTGHLVFARANSLWAVPFDSDRLEVTGEATPVLEEVQVASGGLANFALAGDGSLVYVPGAQANRSLVRVDREGQVERLEAAPGEYWGPTISPDGRRIAVRIGAGGSDLWIYEWERDIMTRLTFDPAHDQWPVWTPDGAHVIFRSGRGGGPTNLYAIPSDGSGSARRLTEGEAVLFPSSWSADGKVLAMIEIPPGGRHDVLTLPLEAESLSSSEPGTPEPFVTSTSFHESKPTFSPDGRFIAYESDESGQVEIYVRPFPGPGGRWQVSNAGGGEPRWSPTSGELFYRNEGALFAVPYTVEGSSFQAGTPRVLFDGTFFSQQLYRWYDVFPDGEHFLMMQTVESEARELVFIVNWFEELKRLVPTN